MDSENYSDYLLWLKNCPENVCNKTESGVEITKNLE